MHFPDTSNEFKGIDSKILLKRTYQLVQEKNYAVVNVDATVCLEDPKIKNYNMEMRNLIADILKISTEDVSIKATTAETMGFIGRKEGLSAYATVLLKKL